MTATSPSSHRWLDLSATVEAVLNDRSVRSEITLDSTPAPARLATHTAALLADVDVDGDEMGSGRLVILFEPEFQPTWDGHVRCVAFVRSNLETELVLDPLLLQVGWSWVTDSLAGRDSSAIALSGTVSRNSSQSFGDLAARDPEGNVEIRVSWTVPEGESLREHILAWCDMLSMTCGLPPLAEGVVSITRPGRA